MFMEARLKNSILKQLIVREQCQVMLEPGTEILLREDKVYRLYK